MSDLSAFYGAQGRCAGIPALTPCPDPEHMHGCYAEACRRAESARKTPPETACAYPRCQADGVILEGAPRHAFGYVVHDSSRPAVASFHPGCWAAYQRESEGRR